MLIRSDLIIRYKVDLPSAATSVLFPHPKTGICWSKLEQIQTTSQI